MKTMLSLRSIGVLISGIAALALCSCDEGSGSGAGGGSASNSAASGSSGSGSTSGTNSGSSTSGGSSLTLSMIDDMEDGDGSITALEGRQGAWYSYNDASATGTQVPAVDPLGMAPFMMTKLVDPRGASKMAANTTGMGFSVWGSGFGLDLSNAGGMAAKKAYDASAYSGVHFYAKVGAGGIGAVRLNIPDGQTAPEGGKCVATGMTPNCSDDFGQNLTLTTTWQEFTIKFSEMKQAGWAKQGLTAIDVKTLYSIHLQTGTKVTFDIWVDDVAFFK